MCEFQINVPLRKYDPVKGESFSEMEGKVYTNYDDALQALNRAFHGDAKHDCLLSRYWQDMFDAIRTECSGSECSVKAKDVQTITAFIDGLNELALGELSYNGEPLEQMEVPSWLSEFVLPRKVYFDIEDVYEARDLMKHFSCEDYAELCPALVDDKGFHAPTYSEFRAACAKVFSNIKTLKDKKTNVDLEPLTRPVVLTTDLMRTSTENGKLAIKNCRPIPLLINVWATDSAGFYALNAMKIRVASAVRSISPNYQK